MCRIEYLLALSLVEIAQGEEFLNLPLDLMRALLVHEALRQQAPGEWGAAQELTLLEGVLRYALDSPHCVDMDMMIDGGAGCVEPGLAAGAFDAPLGPGENTEQPSPSAALLTELLSLCPLGPRRLRTRLGDLRTARARAALERCLESLGPGDDEESTSESRAPTPAAAPPPPPAVAAAPGSGEASAGPVGEARPAPTEALPRGHFATMSVRALKAHLEARGVASGHCLEKSDLVDLAYNDQFMG